MFEGQTLANIAISIGIAFGIAYVVFLIMLFISYFLIKGAKGYLISAWFFIAAFAITAILSIIGLSVSKIIKDVMWMLSVFLAANAISNIYWYKKELKKGLRKLKKGIQT